MNEPAAVPGATPDVEMGEWMRVNPLSMMVQMARTMVQAVIPALAVLYGAASSDGDGVGEFAPYLVPVLGVIIGFTLLGAWLGWVRLRYRVGDNDVRLEQGIISRSARSVPYERIQDVSLEQKLIPRLLGLVEVKFETGAGGKEELKPARVEYEDDAEAEDGYDGYLCGSSTEDAAQQRAAEEAKQPREFPST